jgi:hypothetical protein
METTKAIQPNDTLITWKGEIIEQREKSTRLTIPVKMGKRKPFIILAWLPNSLLKIDGNQISLPLWKALQSVYYLLPQGAQIVNFTKEEAEEQQQAAEIAQ